MPSPCRNALGPQAALCFRERDQIKLRKDLVPHQSGGATGCAPHLQVPALRSFAASILSYACVAPRSAGCHSTLHGPGRPSHQTHDVTPMPSSCSRLPFPGL